MAKNDFAEIIQRSKLIRSKYHQLEKLHHESEWSIEEDALAFLSDAGLIGRYTMAQQGRWPANNSNAELQHKLGECIWWLIILAERMDINIDEALEKFLSDTEKRLNI
ncbi:30S ribosomal protein S15 [Parabacteroides sp. Marseille-P3160]|uniref:30S ribosomal protein S15 n=1 Tax=Parabacteroides sp. Marseille-P3160 TaxID=1917887 RepID=UPI0009BB6804|nr:30S ribosomal protein S15 [Parabacteroides sp. Marseille-P3160]